MTDQTFVDKLLTNLFGTTSGNTTITPGTGGTAQTVTPPFMLRLTTGSVPTNTADGTQLTGTGYTAGGASLGSPFASAPAAGKFSNANPVSWTVQSNWTTVTGIEIWDSATAAVRYLFGALATPISGVGSGDTIQFSAGSITVDASLW